MTTPAPQFLEIGSGTDRRRIAYLLDAGNAPGALWLAGFKSDMVSTKATELSAWCRARGMACTRFDYSGHGQSDGRLEESTTGGWLEETIDVFRRLTRGSQVIVGSSMGGWLALLLLRKLQADAPAEAARIKALLLIAPAWDMTEELMWKTMPETARAVLRSEGVWLRPSAYGDPYPITRKLIEEGRRHLLSRRPWDPGRPVHILHGRLDADVPYDHSRALEGFLEGNWVHLTAVADGEHRLSRPQDLGLLFETLERLAK